MVYNRRDRMIDKDVGIKSKINIDNNSKVVYASSFGVGDFFEDRIRALMYKNARKHSMLPMNTSSTVSAISSSGDKYPDECFAGWLSATSVESIG